jgi:aminotransferase
VNKRQDIAQDVAEIELSAIKEMALRASAVPGAASLTWGLPSFKTPIAIRDAVGHALASDPDIGKYSLPSGLPELQRLAAKTFYSLSGVEIDPSEQVIVTAGNMEGVKLLLRSLLDPGDEVIVLDPGFASHLIQIKLCRGRPVYLPLDETAGWLFDPQRLNELISPRTKCLLLVTPNNPTGTVLPRQALEEIAEVADRHGLLVIVDDPYSHFVYDIEDGYTNPASVPSLLPNLAYLFTFSKAFAMSGWRVGFMVLPKGLAHHVAKVHDATMICAPRISQAAAIEALKRPELTEVFKDKLKARRDQVCSRLDRLGSLFQYVPPQGAYYVFPRIVCPHRDSWEFSMRLLEEAGVVVTPGSAFGPSGERHIRMAFCVNDLIIDEAFDRLEIFASKL